MNVLQALYSQIKSTTAITSLSSNKIYPIVAPVNAVKPYIIYQQISNNPVHTMENDADLHSVRVQVSTWSTSFSQLVGISTQIKATLRDFSGTLGTSNFVVQRIFYDSEFDFPEYDSELDTITYHRSQDFIIWTSG